MGVLNEKRCKKYGVEHPLQCKEIQDKTKQTNLKRYGVEYGLQSQEIKDKSKNTNIKKYGTTNPMQNAEIIEKSMKNSYRKKQYSFPSGNIIDIQGYEGVALDELINSGIQEDDIITGCKNVPTIWYEDENNKKHRHFVDIYIPSQNKCIEVKSTWTAKKKADCIFLKQAAGKKLGLQYEIWIYNNKKERVECHI